MSDHDPSGTPRARRSGRYRYHRPTAAEQAARQAALERARERERRRLVSARDPEVANILSRTKHETVRSRRTREIDEGSLSRASAWTILGSLLPGFGLIPTSKRPVGIVVLVIVGILAVAGLAFAVFGKPVETLLSIGFSSTFLLSALAAVIIGALVWVGLIVWTNHLHNLRERLRGSALSASRALAYVLAIVILLPATHAAHSLVAANSLLSSDSFSKDVNTFSPGEDPWADKERVNILLLGQDEGADRTGTRPDTIMVASIDTKTGRTALFSIPRNLQYVRFPKGSAPAEQFPDGFTYYGHNQNLINAVWTWADEVRPDLFPNDPNPGLTATKMAVEQTLGLKLDYYAQVNLKGFEDLVDAIGGVDFEVERRIPIGGGAAKIEGWIEPGWQHLDGYHALWYARSREGSSDFDRNCRQQRIVRAVTEEVDVPKVARSLPRLLSATQRNMVTDIPSSRLDAFADLAMRIQKGGFNSYPITPDVTNPGNPDWEYLHTWVQASIDDSMKGAAPKSVRGGDAKDGSAGTKDEAPASPTATPTATQEPSPSASESASPTESSSPSNTGTGGATKAPEIEKDPLWRCMPGNTDPND